MTTEDLHVLVVERCHPPGECPPWDGAGDPDGRTGWAECWDPEWEVLHPPTCHPASALADEDWQGPDHRCGLDYDLQMAGDDAFDLVSDRPWKRNKSVGIGDLLPAGRYLCRWYFEVGSWNWEHTERDDRSGIELVEGPVWTGDRDGWDRMPADPAAVSNYAADDVLVLIEPDSGPDLVLRVREYLAGVDVDDPDVIRQYKAMSEEGTA